MEDAGGERDEEMELADMGLGPAEDAPVEEEGVQPDAEEYDDGQGFIEEAEEEAPVVSAAALKARRRLEQETALREQVTALCVKMEKALEDDAQDVMDGKPGTRKLAMLQEIEECARDVRAHQILLGHGFVGLLKGFLEPLQTSQANNEGERLLSLPHIRIRLLVYDLLNTLPISTHDEGGRSILKSSSIGPVLRFYAQVKHETEANRRFVNDLLNRWMLPIIEEGRKAVKDATTEKLRIQALQEDVKRRREVDKTRDKREVAQIRKEQGKAPGDQGYRVHARIPRQSRPDYVHAPAERVLHTQEGKVNKKGITSKINAATRRLTAKNKLGAASSTKLEKATKNVGNEII